MFTEIQFELFLSWIEMMEMQCIDTLVVSTSTADTTKHSHKLLLYESSTSTYGRYGTLTATESTILTPDKDRLTVMFTYFCCNFHAPAVGLEPTTSTLTGWRSAN